MTRNAFYLAAALSLTSACAADIGASDQVDLEEAKVMSYNAMSYNAMSYNALTGNFEAVKAMVEHPLATSSYDGSVSELKNQLSDELTQEFMHYLVGCALKPGQVVKYEDKLLGGTYDNMWEGDIGLCPRWETDKPTEECKQVVSACLLARVNAFDLTVQLSLRGHDGDGNPIPLGPTEQTDFPWREGAFYGDVFDQSALHPEVNIFVGSNGEVQGRNFTVKGAIYRNMFACWSSVWNLPTAYAKDRICAGGGTNCAATPVGACRYHPVNGPIYRCASNDDAATGYGDEDYQVCLNKSATAHFKHAITVFLDDPCALYPDGQSDRCMINEPARKYGPGAWKKYDAYGSK